VRGRGAFAHLLGAVTLGGTFSTTQHLSTPGQSRASGPWGASASATPGISAWLVAAWLCGIILDLLTGPGCYDVALRDFGLLVGAIALARLAQGVHDGSIAPR
jgi:hypothetical protein